MTKEDEDRVGNGVVAGGGGGAAWSMEMGAQSWSQICCNLQARIRILFPITTLMLSRLSLPPDHNLEGVGLLNLCMWRNTDSRWACRLRSAGLVHGSSFYKT